MKNYIKSVVLRYVQTTLEDSIVKKYRWLIAAVGAAIWFWVAISSYSYYNRSMDRMFLEFADQTKADFQTSEIAACYSQSFVLIQELSKKCREYKVARYIITPCDQSYMILTEFLTKEITEFLTENINMAECFHSAAIFDANHNVIAQTSTAVPVKIEQMVYDKDNIHINMTLSQNNNIQLIYSSFMFEKEKIELTVLYHKTLPIIRYILLILFCLIILLPLLFFILLRFSVIFAKMIILYQDGNNSGNQDYFVKSEVNQIGPYILKEKIASGGMAEIYLAEYVRDGGFRRTVAIKKMFSEYKDNHEYVAMFRKEAKLAALLQHPNIVQIYDYNRYDDDHVIEMEYVNGRTLAEIMTDLFSRNQTFRVEEAMYIASQIARGLQYYHTREDESNHRIMNIVHRDISPQNILISHEGEVKITDFGISKTAFDENLTQAGVIKGKIGYLSPEQAQGKPLDPRSDIYSLGIIFYEMLTGQRLYKFSSEIEALIQIPKMDIPPIELPDLQEHRFIQGINHILSQCLAKDLEQRYQSAQEFLNDLLKMKEDTATTYDMSTLSGFLKKIYKV